MAEYERHQPEQTLLHEVVREIFEGFLATAREQGAPVAHFVDCVLPKCPCGSGAYAALLTALPLAWDARLMSEVGGGFVRGVFADLRRRALYHHGIASGLCGAVTTIQRFGSALNLAPHFHGLILDEIYAGPSYQPGPFLPLPPPTTDDVARVMAKTARRVMRLLEKRGLGSGDDPLSADDPLLAKANWPDVAKLTSRFGFILSVNSSGVIRSSPRSGEDCLQTGFQKGKRPGPDESGAGLKLVLDVSSFDGAV